MLQPGPRYDMQRPRYTAERASMFWAANILSACFAARLTSASCPAVRPAIAYRWQSETGHEHSGEAQCPLRQDPRSLYLRRHRLQQAPDAVTCNDRLCASGLQPALTSFL